MEEQALLLKMQFCEFVSVSADSHQLSFQHDLTRPQTLDTQRQEVDDSYTQTHNVKRSTTVTHRHTTSGLWREESITASQGEGVRRREGTVDENKTTRNSCSLWGVVKPHPPPVTDNDLWVRSTPPTFPSGDRGCVGGG